MSRLTAPRALCTTRNERSHINDCRDFFSEGEDTLVMPALALILKLSVLLDIIYVLAQKGRFFGLLIESMQI